MSEINNSAEELNEVVEEIVDDATVMTVPIDETLSISGEAADAKAVGDALANKPDRTEVMTRVTVNGVSSDAQGAVNITGADIPLSSASGAATVNAAMEAMNQSLAGMEQEIEAAGAVQTVNGIAPDENKDVSLGTLITAEEQELDTAQKQQARANIGASSVIYISFTIPAGNGSNLYIYEFTSELISESMQLIYWWTDHPSALFGSWSVTTYDGRVVVTGKRLSGAEVEIRFGLVSEMG